LRRKAAQACLVLQSLEHVRITGKNCWRQTAGSSGIGDKPRRRKSAAS
jgi:hypothetical protein